MIPAYNEAGNIGPVLAQIRACCDYPVVVIDDGSSDATASEARAAGAQTLRLVSRLGAWGATQTGLRYAVQKGHDVVVTMDADGQHEARWVEDLLAAVASGAADVAVGSYPLRGSPLRKLAWGMTRRVSGIALDDITSGFRAYNRQALEVLSGWRGTMLEYQDVGVLMLLNANALRVIDVPVEMRERSDGKSRVFSSWLSVAYYMCYTLLLGFCKRRSSPAVRAAGEA